MLPLCRSERQTYIAQVHRGVCCGGFKVQVQGVCVDILLCISTRVCVCGVYVCMYVCRRTYKTL